MTDVKDKWPNGDHRDTAKVWDVTSNLTGVAVYPGDILRGGDAGVYKFHGVTDTGRLILGRPDSDQPMPNSFLPEMVRCRVIDRAAAIAAERRIALGHLHSATETAVNWRAYATYLEHLGD